MSIAAPEIEPSLWETTTESIPSILLVPFPFQSCKYYFDTCLLTFAGATPTAEGDISSDIAEMIEELTQPEVTKVSKISVEETPVSTNGATEGSSQLEDLRPSTPRLGNISEYLDIPAF